MLPEGRDRYMKRPSLLLEAARIASGGRGRRRCHRGGWLGLRRGRRESSRSVAKTSTTTIVALRTRAIARRVLADVLAQVRVPLLRSTRLGCARCRRRGRRRLRWCHASRQVGPLRSLVLIVDQDCCDRLTDALLEDRKCHGRESIPDVALDDLWVAQAWARDLPVDVAVVRRVIDDVELLVERVHQCDERLVLLGAVDVQLHIVGIEYRMELVHHVLADLRLTDADEVAEELVSGNVPDQRPVDGSVGQNPGVGCSLQLVDTVVALPAHELLDRRAAGKRNVEREAVGTRAQLRVVVDRQQSRLRILQVGGALVEYRVLLQGDRVDDCFDLVRGGTGRSR